MHKVIISAPFGNYLQFQNTTPTLGTYTVQNRGGIFRRIWRVLKTVRYNFQSQSWLNKLGLPNPGIDALPNIPSECILSVHGFSEADWYVLVRSARKLGVQVLELNLSCPNVDNRSLFEVSGPIGLAIDYGMNVIAKLPPVRWLDMGSDLYLMGVRYYHLCNTIPTPGGGMSGKPLKQYSLWAIEEFRREFGRNVVLIGGGGITCLDDVKEYIQAGADHVAIGSMLFNPFNWRKVEQLTEYFKT